MNRVLPSGALHNAHTIWEEVINLSEICMPCRSHCIYFYYKHIISSFNCPCIFPRLTGGLRIVVRQGRALQNRVAEVLPLECPNAALFGEHCSEQRQRPLRLTAPSIPTATLILCPSFYSALYKLYPSRGHSQQAWAEKGLAPILQYECRSLAHAWLRPSQKSLLSLHKSTPTSTSVLICLLALVTLCERNTSLDPCKQSICQVC